MMAEDEPSETRAGRGPGTDAGAGSHDDPGADGDAYDRGGYAHDEHGHDTTGSSSRKLGAVAAINLVGFVVELAGGWPSGRWRWSATRSTCCSTRSRT
jgi:hypothetical protein